MVMEIEQTQAPSPAAAADSSAQRDAKPVTPLTAEQLMPTDAHAVECLRERAEHFARQDNKQLLVVDHKDFIRFRVGEKELYGISYEYIEQILPAERLTPVPCTPRYIAGVINWCGQLLTVIDIAQLFNIANNRQHKNTTIIVVSDHKMTVGIMIDEIEENGRFSPSQLEAPLLNAELNSTKFIKGIWQGRVTILDIENLLSDQQIIINKN